MFCRYCGKKLKDDSVFCKYCGKKLIENEQQKFQPLKEKEEKYRKTSRKKPFYLLMISIVILCLVGGIWGAQKLKHQSQVEEMERWDRGIAKLQKEYETYIPKQEKEDYIVCIQQYKELENLGKYYSQKEQLYSKLTALFEIGKEKEKTILKNQLEVILKRLKEIPYATEEEKEIVHNNQSLIEENLDKGEILEAKNDIQSLEQYLEEISKKKDGLFVQLIQADYSNFPKVNLIFDVQDENGNFVENLDASNIFLSEKNNKNIWKTQKIKAGQMIEEKWENLSLNLVADISGSMEGLALEKAKDVMKNFAESILRNKTYGQNKMAITPFNHTVYREMPFTSDFEQVKAQIDSLESSGGTALYDALIYSINRVKVEDGAKYVIAFTDGQDEHSESNIDDIIFESKKYNIPIYIVLIGESGKYEMEYLCKQTGGELCIVNSWDDQAIFQFYLERYKDMKQCYMIEYELPEDSNLLDQRDWEVYVRSGELGGIAQANYTPYKQVFGNLLQKYLYAYELDLNVHRQYRELKNYVGDMGQYGKYSLESQMRNVIDNAYISEWECVPFAQEHILRADITNCEKKSADCYLIETVEEYSTKRKWNYNYMTSNQVKYNPEKEIAEQVLNRYSYMIDWYSMYRIYELHTQKAVYEIRKINGEWKMCSYTKGIDFSNIKVYHVEED